jgi:hypothetical protein
MVTEISKGRDSTVPVFVGLSTDTKPTDVDNGSEFRALDTGKLYYFDAENVEWCEQPGEGGGGGGDSDFSTATVEFICSQYRYSVTAVAIESDEISVVTHDSYDDNPLTMTIPLYKGKYSISAAFDLTNVDFNVMPTFTGDITLDMGTGAIVVAGDGTITCAGLNP